MSDFRKQILLGNVGPVRMCKRILKSQTSETAEIPFYKISTFGSMPDAFIDKVIYKKFSTKYPFPKKGDVLISAAGTVGKTVIYDGSPAYFQDSNIVWIENDESQILNKYLYYFYQTKPWLTTNGSTIKRIYNDDLRSIKVAIPDIHVQHKISTVLNDLDSKIDLNNKINAELEAMAKLIYDYWFVQFDFPDQNGKPYKTSGGKMVWNEELKREIPEGWEVKQLSDLIEVAKNGDWGKEIASQGSVKVYCIRGADINGLNGISSFEPPIRYIQSSHSDRLLQADDLIIEISGGSPTQSTGRMAHISQQVLARLENNAVCSNFCKGMSLKDKKLSYIVNEHWKMLYESGTFFNFEGKTSGIKNLLFEQLTKDIKIALPNTKDLVNKYYHFAEGINTQKQNNLSQNQKLSELRDWLLPMLMNGQVKVGEVNE